jgi:hypothetical protein
MTENFLVSLLSSLAVIVIMLIAIGLMVGVVSPGEAMKQILAILGIVTVIVLAPRILYAMWSGMSLTAHAGLIVIGILILWWKVCQEKDAKK